MASSKEKELALLQAELRIAKLEGKKLEEIEEERLVYLDEAGAR